MKKGVDFIGVGVCAIVINEEGKILAARRGPKARNERGKWEFPGGSIEFGDTLRQSIVREMIEELGVEIETGDQLPAIDHLLPDEKQHWVANAFISKITKGTPQILEPEKCVEIRWVTWDEMKKMDITLAVREYVPIIDNYFKKKKN